MDAMIGRMEATPGNRDALARVLVTDVGDMRGCVSYLVAVDPNDDDGLWIAEAWESPEAHHDWLASAHVQALIERIKPWMVGYEQRHELVPVGGLPSIFGPGGLAR